jgi:hypothetical protein
MVRDICHGDQVASRVMVMQHKTKHAVQFEITPATREAVQKWIKQAALRSEDFLFPSRFHDSPHLGTRQYAQLVESWVEALGLDPADCSERSMQRTKATLIYWRMKSLRAVQLLRGHSKLKSTARYLGIEVDDALGDLSHSASGRQREGHRHSVHIGGSATRYRQCSPEQCYWAGNADSGGQCAGRHRHGSATQAGLTGLAQPQAHICGPPRVLAGLP